MRRLNPERSGAEGRAESPDPHQVVIGPQLPATRREFAGGGGGRSGLVDCRKSEAVAK